MTGVSLAYHDPDLVLVMDCSFGTDNCCYFDENGSSMMNEDEDLV